MARTRKHFAVEFHGVGRGREVETSDKVDHGRTFGYLNGVSVYFDFHTRF